jgi:hypothetical protein
MAIALKQCSKPLTLFLKSLKIHLHNPSFSPKLAECAKSSSSSIPESAEPHREARPERDPVYRGRHGHQHRERRASVPGTEQGAHGRRRLPHHGNTAAHRPLTGKPGSQTHTSLNPIPSTVSIFPVVPVEPIMPSVASAVPNRGMNHQPSIH